jgi:hypothetical protein
MSAFEGGTIDWSPHGARYWVIALGTVGFRYRMTEHGFRSLCSTIVNESGRWRAEIVEAALAHLERNEARGVDLVTRPIRRAGRDD